MVLAAVCGCSRDGSTQLRDRAKAWGDLLLQLRSLKRETAIRQLEDFIEPSAGRTQRAIEYYEGRIKAPEGLNLLSYSVDDVRISGDNTSAEVRYTTVLELPDRTKRTVSQLTKWQSVDNQWYRIILAAEIKVNIQ
jgi:hypothetical protein